MLPWQALGFEETLALVEKSYYSYDIKLNCKIKEHYEYKQ